MKPKKPDNESRAYLEATSTTEDDAVQDVPNPRRVKYVVVGFGNEHASIANVA